MSESLTVNAAVVAVAIGVCDVRNDRLSAIGSHRVSV